jgi:hypothetical protein
MSTEQDLAALLEASTPEAVEVPDMIAPDDPNVILPVGLWDPFNGLRDTAIVRELNGYDEEHIARAKNLGTAMQAVLERAVVSIGGKPLEKGELDLLTIGDRTELMIAVRRTTWGDELDISTYCANCEEMVDVVIPLVHIPRIALGDKDRDRTFTLVLPSGKEAKMTYPTGGLHKKVLAGDINTGAEMTTAIIVDCVHELTGIPVMNEIVAKSMPMRDRHAISGRFVGQIPGPDLDKVPTACPKCETEFETAIPVGALFPN